MIELATDTENKQSGLKIDKKTVVIICILLAAVMAFAGILTQVLPAGEFQTEYNEKAGKELIVEG